MPSKFTWYLWDSRVTWLSGFALLVIVYYMQADVFLIDRSIMDLSPLQAAAFSLVSLLVVWFIYDGLCRSPLGRHDLALAVIVYLFLVALAYAFTHVLSGRAAVNQIGAVVGTFMVANAFTMIHPNQRKAVKALLAGQQPDPALVTKARQRSIHNNYLTLPVIFLMISNHYPLLYATRYNWLIVAIILALGPVIRHFFNSRSAGKGSPWWTWAVTAVGMVAIAYLSSLGPRPAKTAESSQGAPAAAPAQAQAQAQAAADMHTVPAFEKVQEIVMMRCLMCHAAGPVWGRIAMAGKDVVLDSPQNIRRHAHLIDVTAVRSHAMPPGNLTQMTMQERDILARWLKAGAP